MTPESNAPSVDPQIVGNAFVQKYYNHIYESPSEVHRFYLENSVIGRAGLDGEMVNIKSLKAINDQIMSLDYQNSKIQILTVDSQPSLENGVVTLVTGLVIGKDGERVKFYQNFFLVPQKGSYFVLNDIFRYESNQCFEQPEATNEVEESPQVIESTNIITEPADEIVEVVVIPSQAKTTVTKPANGHAKVPKEKIANGNKAAEAKVQEPASAIANGHAKVPEEKIVNGNSNLPNVADAILQEDAPKRSFAAIVQSLAHDSASFHVKASPAKPKRVEKPSVATEPKAPTPIPEQASAKTIEQPGGSIFVANLPMDATPEQLFEAFNGFGAIKINGIQVRSYMEKRNCFGFVAYESGESIKNVLKAHKESPIMIGNRRASIEEKRGSNNENGRRASARNNGFRPRGNGFNGGRGYYGFERQNGEANGDSKAYQKNGHGNAQTRN